MDGASLSISRSSMRSAPTSSHRRTRIGRSPVPGCGCIVAGGPIPAWRALNPRMSDRSLEYVRRVRRLSALARRFGFDALIVIGAIEAALEVALRKNHVLEPGT